MTPEEEKQIQYWNHTLSFDAQIRCLFTEDRRSHVLRDYCDRFSALASRVSVLTEEGDENEPPSIEVQPRLRYHAVPLGKALPSFLQAVENQAPTALTTIPDTTRIGLQAVTVPAFIQLFVAPQCPHCPLVVQQLLPLVSASESVHVSIIDGTLYPEMTEKHAIRSVPTVLLDNHFRWTGSVPQRELLEVMAKRDLSKLGASSLERMLKDGDASHMAALMIEMKAIIPAFLDVLAHEKMFVRLGAMVVMEELCQRDPELARSAVDPIWDRFARANEQVQGDLLYIIGQTGSRYVIPKLEGILNSPVGPEVKEAARDALDRIRSG